MAAPSVPLTGTPRQALSVDSAAAGFALVCAVHCAVAPVLVVAATAAGVGWLLSEPFGQLAIAGSLLVAGWALRRGSRQHGAAGPMQVGALALPCFGVAEFAGLPPTSTAAAAAAGGVVLALAHLWNRRLLRAR